MSIRTTAFCLLIAVVCYSAPAQGASYRIPVETALGSKSDNTERFYLVGWSTDGIIAYCQVLWQDAAGFYSVNLTILDTKSDKTIASISAEIGEGTGPSPLTRFWKTKRKKIAATLTEFGIQEAPGHLQSFPLKLGDDTIHVSIRQTCSKKAEDEYCGFYKAKQTSVEAVSSTRGRKTILQATDKYYCNSLTVRGLLKSANSSHSAVIIETVGTGLECDDRYIGHFLVGCDLEKGFKQDKAPSPQSGKTGALEQP
jgi:hypothetical protein